MKFFFVPGRKWLLSQAEISSILSMKGYRSVELTSGPDILLYDIQADSNAIVDVFSRLGGSVKAGYVVDDPYEYLEKDFLTVHIENKKVPFSVSFYDVSSGFRAIQRSHASLGMEIKKWFKEKGVSARFVSKFGSIETSAVLLKTNHVLEKGFELNRFSHPKTHDTIWGVTLAIQDYEGFSYRDYSRPRSNKLKGMIPPKLARIMINLATLPENGILWDPFCGSGTIAMEALTLGYQVLASDIDPLAIEETKENLAWICEKNWISHSNYKVFEHDVRKELPETLLFDAIVGEPYLGPVILRTVNMDTVRELNDDIQPLYDGLGREIQRQIQKGRHGNIVVVVPGFRTASGWLDMEGTFDKFSEITELPIKTQNDTKHLQWDRPDSIIRRNISKFSY